MEDTNINRKTHGGKARNSLEELLDLCKNNGLISSYIKNYTIGRQGYSDKQFSAPFLVIFHEDEKWSLFTTTSMRTDRIKGQQWDSHNLKEINNTICSSYLVFPDSVNDKTRKNFKRQGKKYSDKFEYSALDDIICLDELYNLIEASAFKGISKGKAKDLQGKILEKRIATILSFTDNLDKWNQKSPNAVGLSYDVFFKILTFFGLTPKTILRITATSEDKIIGYLPSGGLPKTDVLADIEFTDGTRKTYTISCKRTSGSSVSVHQYKADKFADVLDKKNMKLRELLNTFQINGNLKKFSQENKDALTEELNQYTKKLALWVFGGVGGEGDPNTHWAKYLLTYKNDSGEYSIHTIEEYYQILLNNNIKGQFGTVFSWTYASGQKGKSIQLKSKIL